MSKLASAKEEEEGAGSEAGSEEGNAQLFKYTVRSYQVGMRPAIALVNCTAEERGESWSIDI